jgi:VanZ family protein
VDRLASAYASSPLLFWVGGSVLIYALLAHALWLTNSQPFRRSPSSRWSVQVGRFLFYVGILYLALGGWPRRPYQGLLSLEDIGLVGLSVRWPLTRWLEAVGTSLGLGLLVFLILLLAWSHANRSAAEARLHFSPRPWWAIVVDVLYMEGHWAFYRGALAVTLGDVYGGVFLGLGLVYLEWSLNPAWRQGWRMESQAASQWLRGALALVAALIYLLTRNLWVCLGVHWLLELTFWRLGRAPAQSLDVPLIS